MIVARTKSRANGRNKLLIIIRRGKAVCGPTPTVAEQHYAWKKAVGSSDRATCSWLPALSEPDGRLSASRSGQLIALIALRKITS